VVKSINEVIKMIYFVDESRRRQLDKRNLANKCEWDDDDDSSYEDFTEDDCKITVINGTMPIATVLPECESAADVFYEFGKDDNTKI
jgi:hypothetical protein